jgi:hypothetical protein
MEQLAADTDQKDSLSPSGRAVPERRLLGPKCEVHDVRYFG